MRVQRAPRAADQPQPRDADPRPRLQVVPVVDAPPRPASGGLFCAEVSLDLTDLRRDADDEQTVAAVAVRLLAACRAEGLVDDDTVLQVLTPLAAGWSVARVEQAVRQSAYGIATGLGAATARAPDLDARTLTLVRTPGPDARAAGDWGLPGPAVATLGAVRPSLVPWTDPASGALVVASRQLGSLSLAVPTSLERAGAVLRVLDRTARAVQRSEA